MASVSTIRGVELRILIGDGGSPEAFAEWCMINTDRGINWATTGNDEEIPDCDDLDGMAWNQHTKMGKSGTITGSGKLDTDNVQDAFEWWGGEDPRDVRIEVGDIGYWEGQWHLTEFNITGTRGTVAAATVSMKSHGVQTWVPS